MSAVWAVGGDMGTVVKILADPKLLDGFVSYRQRQGNAEPSRGCGACLWCENEWMRATHALNPAALPRVWGMIVCSQCGCKRCPKATHHDHECTHSNEPDQPGSVYGDYFIDTSWLEEEPDA